MPVEQIIFTFISFAIFVLMFFRMIKNNDTTYVVILVLEAMGISLNFLEVLFDIKLNMIFVIIKYILAILLPILIIILEKKGISLLEMVNLQKAKIAMNLGDNKKAKQALLKILDKNPNSYKAHLMLAQVYENEGGMRKAIDEYVQAIDLNKKDYDSYYKVAKLLNGLDKKEEASEMLYNLLNKKPEITDASILLGEILIENEMYKEAVNVYQDALRYNQVNYDLYYNLGIAYTMLNDFQNAKTCYEKAAAINTALYNGYYNLAQISLIYNDLEEAEKYFMQSVMSKDVEPKAYYNLAKIYMIKGDKENAIKFLNVAIDIDHSFYKKAEAEPIFIPIKSYINYPDMEEEQDIQNGLTKKEIKTQEHLEETMKLVGKLSYNNIKIKKEKKIDEKNRQDQREKE